MGDGAWINGGFFVLEPEVLKYIKSDDTIWEQEPLMPLARENQLNAYKHTGFWKPMDTMKDLIELKNVWKNKKLWRIQR